PQVRNPGSDKGMSEEHTVDINDLIAVRMDKRRGLMEAGVPPFGGRVERAHAVGQVLGRLRVVECTASWMACRLRAIRGVGRLTFMDLQDGGRRIQLFCRINTMGEEAYQRLEWLDIGDIVGVEGLVMRTRRGEESVEVSRWELLAKSLRP